MAEPSPGVSRYRWLVLVVATATQMGTAFAFLGIGVLAAHFRIALSLDGTRTGLIVTAVALAPLLVMIPVGRLLDRRSETIVMTAGAAVLALGVAAAGLVDGYGLILMVLFVGGAGYAVSQPGGSKVVAHWFPLRERGLAMGIRQTGLPLGGAAAAAVLPRLAESHSLGVALMTAAVVVAATGGAFALFNKPHGDAREATQSPLRTEILTLVRMPSYRRLLLVGIVMVAGQLAVIAHLMSFLLDAKRISLLDGAWVLFAIQLAGVAGRIVLARWSDRSRSGRAAPLLAAVAATAAAAGLAPFVPGSLSLWIVFGTISGFFSFGWYGPWVVAVAESNRPAEWGLTLAVAMTANQLAIVVAPPLFGLLGDISGTWVAPWLTLSAVTALVALLLERDRRHTPLPGAATTI